MDVDSCDIDDDTDLCDGAGGKVLLLSDEEDQDLQDKMDREIRMREGTAKLLAASRHPQQMLEAAKSLLTCNSRIIGYMSELQRRKSDQVLRRKKIEGNQRPCKARLSLSDIRLPLMWKDTDHFKNKGDHRRYAVFCMVKIGTEIKDTLLLKDVDRSMTEFTFDEPVIFDDVQPDFVCHIEVYCHKLYDDLTMASTPKKIKKKFNDIGNSVGRSVGRRLSGIKDDPEFLGNGLVGPKFDCIGHAELRLADVNESILTHHLVLDNSSFQSITDVSSLELPLYDNFCCRLVVQPLCLTTETIGGTLKVQSAYDDSWDEYWCSLQNLEIRCWPSENLVNDPPTETVPVTKDTQISQSCDIPHSLELQQLQASSGEDEVVKLKASSRDEITKWWEGLQQHLLDQVMWEHACDKLMAIKPTTPRRPSSLIQTRPHSMIALDKTDCDSPMTRILNRLNVDTEKAETPTNTNKAKSRRSLRSSSSIDSMSSPFTSTASHSSKPHITMRNTRSQSFSTTLSKMHKHSSIETDV